MGIAVNLGVAYLTTILVVYYRLILMADMVTVVAISMFELMIPAGYSFQRRYVEFLTQLRGRCRLLSWQMWPLNYNL